jgi:hypothetical protein
VSEVSCQGRRVAELIQRLPDGLLSRHSFRCQLLEPLGQVIANLVGDLRLLPLSQVQQLAQQRQVQIEFVWRHGASPVLKTWHCS